MQTIRIQKDLKNTISELANKLKISEYDVIRRAVLEYSEKAKRKESLMSFAGSIDEEAADSMLKAIRESRVDKILDVEI